MYFFRNMLNNKIYLKSHDYRNFEVAMSINDILGQQTWCDVKMCMFLLMSEPQVLLGAM